MPEKYFDITIGRSSYLLLYLIVIHSVMLLMIIQLLSNGTALITLLVSFIYYCRRYQWLKPYRSVIKINRNTKKQWHLYFSDETQSVALNLKHCIVTPQLLILYFEKRAFWQSNSVIILADSVDGELFRQLRVYLRDPKLFQQ